MERSQLIGMGLLVAVALAAGAWYARSAPQPAPPVVVASAEEAAVESGLTVHVSGAVAEPGMVLVPQGARVADAVVAAGGALPDADLHAVNLAARVSDGQLLAVPSASAGGGGTGSTGHDGRVAVNTASAADLESLPGVGPVLAQRIVDHRLRHGPFSTVEDLLDVPGIGEGKLAALRDAAQVP
jgi:competence protein ComEA